MPAFGTATIFGTAVTMNTSSNPRSSQINSYFGLGGLETLDGGSRGRYTQASGVLFGASAVALAAAEALFRSFDDGIPRVLVDTYGIAWDSVRLVSFQPQGRVRQSPAGVYFRPYTSRFLHLV